MPETYGAAGVDYGEADGTYGSLAGDEDAGEQWTYSLDDEPTWVYGGDD